MLCALGEKKKKWNLLGRKGPLLAIMRIQKPSGFMFQDIFLLRLLGLLSLLKIFLSRIPRVHTWTLMMRYMWLQRLWNQKNLNLWMKTLTKNFMIMNLLNIPNQLYLAMGAPTRSSMTA